MQNENKKAEESTIDSSKIENLFTTKLTSLYPDGSFALNTETNLEDVIHKLAIIEFLFEKHGIASFIGLEHLLNIGEIKKISKKSIPLFSPIGDSEVEYKPTKKAVKLELGIHPLLYYPMLKKDNNTIYCLKWEDIIKLSGLSNFLKDELHENN